MSTSVSNIILVILTFPLVLFNLTILVFLIACRRRRGDTVYKSSFFTIITITTCVDVVSECANIFMVRLSQVDLLKPYYLSIGFVPSVVFATTGYCLYTQSCLHLCVAINRLWVVRTASNMTRTKIGSICAKAIWLTPLTGVFLLGPRLFNVAEYSLTATNDLVMAYKENYVKQYQITVAALVPLTSAIITFVIDLVTVAKYRKLLSQQQQMTKQVKTELRLFAHAIVVFVAHLLMAVIEVAIYVAYLTGIDAIRAFAMPQYPWANDLLNLISGPALLLVAQGLWRLPKYGSTSFTGVTGGKGDTKRRQKQEK
uniref:G_PROTEIN_RECEP_F1_2 domain-containing protein n=1 Tax=Panagrellus redivivus TaxID=6233 RepID=A0A7E4VPZ4_PANRE